MKIYYWNVHDIDDIYDIHDKLDIHDIHDKLDNHDIHDKLDNHDIHDKLDIYDIHDKLDNHDIHDKLDIRDIHDKLDIRGIYAERTFYNAIISILTLYSQLQVWIGLLKTSYSTFKMTEIAFTYSPKNVFLSWIRITWIFVTFFQFF